MEGYVWATYGSERYLRQAVASVITLRRYDQKRPVALYCSETHRSLLDEHGIVDLFDEVSLLDEEHRSIVGVKHHLHELMPFQRTLWLDADMVWCRDPDPLWQQLAAFSFTATGHDRADAWFGGPKDIGIIPEYVLDRRRDTLERFGLDHLPRVQSGLMYGQDRSIVRRLCAAAEEFLKRSDETHFRSRTHERGRTLESCEWSLAMAMSAQNLQVFPWFYGYQSPQLDFVDGLTRYDSDFETVRCRYYCDRFVYSLRGIPNESLRRWLTWLMSRLPGRGDTMEVTPFLLHFGWLHQKEPFEAFARRTWQELTAETVSTTTKNNHGRQEAQ